MSGAKTKYGVIDNPFNIDYSFIKEAYTDDKVFIKLTCKLLDAIESINVRVFI